MTTEEIREIKFPSIPKELDKEVKEYLIRLEETIRQAFIDIHRKIA